MKPLPAIRFIDSALAVGGPFALPYADKGYKWIIREHLLNLFYDFPTLTPSIDTFTYDNGTSLHLLNARGTLPSSSDAATTTIPLVIWIQHSYPIFPPLVFLSSDAANPIVRNHPFVDPSSGATASPYLIDWNYPRSNLSDMVRNLAWIFAFHPPLISPSSCAHPPAGWPSSASVLSASKRQAIDCLMGAIYYDLSAMNKQADEDISSLWVLRGVLRQREGVIAKMLVGLAQERARMKRRLREMAEEKDTLQNWVRVNESAGDELDARAAFEGADEQSKMMIEEMAADHGIEDVIYGLDEGLKHGVVEFQEYLKQVRKLAKEQFFHRAAVVVNVAGRKPQEIRKEQERGRRLPRVNVGSFPCTYD